ncbi:MAG: 3-phosphoserine/phosphohydroxythreonine transaminase [Gammaproteobacteria bacterium]
MTSERVFNFSAGPAALPEPVLNRIRSDLPSWQSRGMSVMEVSHRSKEFTDLAKSCENNLRQLLAIPANYKVLFMQGGATAQFAAVPLNLASPERTADYVVTGTWGVKAVAQAAPFVRANVAADSKSSAYTAIPEREQWQLDSDAAYVHYTPNETIGGVEYHTIPEVGDVPLVGDMSSTILSRPLDVSRFGVIYAGAQKNIGPAGITVVIVRDDLLGRAAAHTPTVLDYTVTAKAESMSNTPPTFAWYVAGLVFEWLLEQGGLQAMAERNASKQSALYAQIDGSDFYANPVDLAARSWMNVPFTLAEPALDAVFLTEAGEAGLVNLKGHRSAGGMRASLYNAMPPAGVTALTDFMQDFERRHG